MRAAVGFDGRRVLFDGAGDWFLEGDVVTKVSDPLEA